jgi:methionine sulfoxide reductase heme-binding subunit
VRGRGELEPDRGAATHRAGKARSRDGRRRRWLEGWILVGWTALLVGGLAVLLLATERDDLGAALRATGRTSVALFLATFAAAPARRLWPAPITGWLLRNRRQVGVSFAVSHAIHLGLLVALATRTPERFTADPLGLAPGAIAYLFLAAMVATSFDRSAAWLGPRRWKRLHRTGMWILWLFFTVTYTGKVAQVPALAPFTAALWLVAIARAALALRARRRRSASAR